MYRDAIRATRETSKVYGPVRYGRQPQFRAVPRPPRTLRLKLFGILAGLLLLLGGIYHATARASASPVIQSGTTGYCLDLYHDSAAANNPVDSWPCNHSDAQVWTKTSDHIRHNGYCLSADNDFTVAGTVIIVAKCSDAPGQIWLNDKTGYLNPHSGKCLSLPGGKTEQQLVLADCKALTSPAETWHASAPLPPCGGTEGQKVACLAEQEWTTWQSGTADHNTLLNQYTDGYAYEQWCADFISYIYKQAGYPFTGGEADGWSENNANNIQNLGFTKHDPANYTPQPGDIAYFDYNGGHVEIVVSGGPEPTFIYGDSGTTDPTTGNGDMATNTLLRNGSEGQLTYYLSPN